LDPAAGFWRRRIVAPLLRQLQQGLTPAQAAATVAIGFVLAVFPVFGSTTVLCTLAALRFRLNQPLIQVVNGLCGGLQVLLMIPFFRAGEWLGAPHLSLSMAALREHLAQMPWQTAKMFSTIVLGGIGVWLLLAPPVAALIYFSVRPVLAALARGRTS